MSYDMTWVHLKRLMMEENYVEKVRDGHWLWIYDNSNMHQTTRHERQSELLYEFLNVIFNLNSFADQHNKMLNFTTRIAVEITNLPPFDFRWDDPQPFQ